MSSCFVGLDATPSVPLVRVNDLGSSAASVLRPFPKAYGMQVLVHSNEHPPPHVHIQVDGRDYTRYAWPSLQPLKGDAALPGQVRRALNRYVKKYGASIDERVRIVYAANIGRAV